LKYRFNTGLNARINTGVNAVRGSGFMMKRLIPVIIAVLLSGCHEEERGPSFQKRILGNWGVVKEDGTPSIVEWGVFYVGSVKLYEDKSFKIDLFDQTDDPTKGKHGTWELKSHADSIQFNTYIDDASGAMTDTTVFRVSFTPDEKLVLENDWIRILHRRLDN
jgi:hypothetical protein